MCICLLDPGFRLGRESTETPPDRLSTAQIRAEFLDWNAEQPNPWPLCPFCDAPFDLAESHPLFPTLCLLCGTQTIDDVVMNLARAKGKKARKRALKAIKALAK